MSANGLSAEEARSALETVRTVERQTRRAVSLRGGGPIVTVWGVVWLVGYLGSYFLDGIAEGLLWMLANLLGAAATLTIVARVARRVRDPAAGRIGLLWLALLLFAAVIVWVSWPLTYELMGLLIALVMMFGYVVMGIFVDRTFLWLGSGVSALAVTGYLLLPQQFELWMAFLGGGALVGGGLYITRRWR
ncbi:MAG: hypothetical protein R3325_10510 [Thermoanaerobaculia bacterium]|nr:hypothetical protein [Thermoanaerobaculia bacterium]